MGITYTDIANEIANRHKVSMAEVRSEERWKHICDCRREICRTLRRHNLSLMAIGDIINRHHGTVINYLGQKKRRPRPMVKGFDPIHLGC